MDGKIHGDIPRSVKRSGRKSTSRRKMADRSVPGNVERKVDQAVTWKQESRAEKADDSDILKERNIDDKELEELSKLRCTSECTEDVAEREKRRQRSSDYPGLAFGRSAFGSDTFMKFSIIKNELHNILNSQLKRTESEVAALNRRVQSLEQDLEKSGISLAAATTSLAETVAENKEPLRLEYEDFLNL